MKKNIIFLDIDGILNSIIFSESHPNEDFDPNATKCLSDIYHKHNCDIVLASTWKNTNHPNEPDVYHMYQKLIHHLANYDMTIADQTPDHFHDRPREIYMWLQQHPETENYIILDDDFGPSAYSEYHLEKHLIQTQFFCLRYEDGGLQPKHVQQANTILKKY